MSEESHQALVPIEERQVDFYGEGITAALVETAGQDKPEIYVPLRRSVNFLAWTGLLKHDA